ncbi:MAG: hypothetical protein VW082_09100, partial [Candidatus Nanopelagicales bacterium]
VRPGLTITSTGSAQLMVDDQVLQEVPWTPGGATTVAVTDTKAYSGTQSLTLLNYTQGSQVEYTFDEPPGNGSTVTATAWNCISRNSPAPRRAVSRPTAPGSR